MFSPHQWGLLYHIPQPTPSSHLPCEWLNVDVHSEQCRCNLTGHLVYKNEDKKQPLQTNCNKRFLETSWVFFKHCLRTDTNDFQIRLTKYKLGVPVEGSASFNSHPVNSKVHLPDKSRHADGHCVGHTQHHTGLLPHNPAGSSTQQSHRDKNWHIVIPNRSRRFNLRFKVLYVHRWVLVVETITAYKWFVNVWDMKQTVKLIISVFYTIMFLRSGDERLTRRNLTLRSSGKYSLGQP